MAMYGNKLKSELLFSNDVQNFVQCKASLTSAEVAGDTVIQGVGGMETVFGRIYLLKPKVKSSLWLRGTR